MAINILHSTKKTETNQPLQSFSRTDSLGQENDGRQPHKKQLDLDGIRELILEMRL